LLSHYFQLSVDDLQQVSPRVHEWLLDRVSHARAALNVGALATLTVLYFLFPESTVRHSVVGLMVQADSLREPANEDRWDTPLMAILDSINGDGALALEDQVDQLLLLAELLMDYVDVFPESTERCLSALHRSHRDETLTTHFTNWAQRLGGESGVRVLRAIEKSDGPR
jgi:hypothetical protein